MGNEALIQNAVIIFGSIGINIIVVIIFNQDRQMDENY
jgi:hypothetical protein